MKEKYYITTPIYYPSDKLHIGNAYCTVATDAIARYKKLRGYDVKFLTGTDEHGQKIEKVAIGLNKEPKIYLDDMIAWIKDLWKLLDIDYDIFIRTTDGFHEKAVQKIFEKLYSQGDIYKGSYEGLYCLPCEAFFTERQLADGKCPDCGRAVEPIQEEAYFLKLSKYADRLMAHIDSHPDFIQPVSRKNEMVNNFIKPGLEDLCVSRTSFKWGIPVDFDPDHVVYVWIDALSNYITALGYYSDDDSLYKKYWPADVHIVGKEIVRFHTIIWPIILMAMGEPLPKQVFGHGWLTKDGVKMSKSMGNVVDPMFLAERYGSDALRYFLLREFSFGQDGNFTDKGLLQRLNSDLANDLGNLLSRTVGMIDKYFGGRLPSVQEGNPHDIELIKAVEKAYAAYGEHFDKFAVNEALEDVWVLIRRANKYIDETAPWVLAKNEGERPRLAGIMYSLCEVLRITAVLISPVMPQTPQAIYSQLSINDGQYKTFESAGQFGLLPNEVTVAKGEIVFPRLDIEKELLEISMKASEAKGEASPVHNKEDKPAKPAEKASEITIDDFAKVEMKVGVIMECKALEGSDKLLVSQVKLGDKSRQIVSGIAQYYKPEEMVGKKVIVVTNLRPVKLRGALSEGMLLAASDENGCLKVVTTDGEISDGAGVR